MYNHSLVEHIISTSGGIRVKTSKLRKIGIIYSFFHVSIYFSWIYFFQHDQEMLKWGGDVFSTIGPFVSFLVLFYTYFRLKTQPEGLFWLFLSLGSMIYTIAELIWDYYELILQLKVPFPGWADFFYFLQILFYLAAFAYKLYEQKDAYRMIRLLFDIFIVMTVAASFSWYYIIHSMFAKENSSFLFITVSVGYPIGDLGLLFGAVSIFFISKTAFPRRVFLFLFFGLLTQVFADSAYLYLSTQDTYSSGSLIDPLWSLALLLVGVSGLFINEIPEVKAHQLGLPPFEISPTPPVHLFLPYTSVVFLFISLLFQENDVNSIEIGSGISILLIIVRQISTLLENQRLLQVLHKLNEELDDKVRHRTHELMEKNEALLKAHQIKDNFTTAMTHELRTPLHTILGYVELVEDEEDGPISSVLRHDLQVIRRSAKRQLRLVEDLLNLSRILHGKEEIHLETIEVEEVIQQIREELLYLSIEKGLEFKVKVEIPSTSICTDRLKLEHILINLATNAIKFTERGYILIQAKQLKNHLELVVEDSGIGIPSEYHDYIFEQFTQVDGGVARRYGGTGLGLAIVKNYVQLLNGTIEVLSLPGVGSQFIVKIPI
jgi:signal transduction histidine kinase